MSENCLKAYCPKCDITFGVAPLPLEVSKMSEAMMNAKCPECDAGVHDLQLDASEGAPDYPLPGSADMNG